MTYPFIVSAAAQCGLARVPPRIEHRADAYRPD